MWIQIINHSLKFHSNLFQWIYVWSSKRYSDIWTFILLVGVIKIYIVYSCFIDRNQLDLAILNQMKHIAWFSNITYVYILPFIMSYRGNVHTFTFIIQRKRLVQLSRFRFGTWWDFRTKITRRVLYYNSVGKRYWFFYRTTQI